ncbi:MAG TPA: GNAT family N-acetyltransferase [Bacillota bacterium]|nr:GNAT family N-acetyltransferase [Bacillota bacterium]
MAATIITAGKEHIEAVQSITHTTIQKNYPYYYPKDVVDFFLESHDIYSLTNSIWQRKVYLLEDDGVFVGTGSINGYEICRLFVLPEHQGKGYGSMLMDFLEKKVFLNFPVITLFLHTIFFTNAVTDLPDPANTKQKAETFSVTIS